MFHLKIVPLAWHCSVFALSNLSRMIMVNSINYYGGIEEMILWEWFQGIAVPLLGDSITSWILRAWEEQAVGLHFPRVRPLKLWNLKACPLLNKGHKSRLESSGAEFIFPILPSSQPMKMWSSCLQWAYSLFQATIRFLSVSRIWLLTRPLNSHSWKPG